MSLLMEALRKAEQQKQQGAAEKPAAVASDALELAPLPGEPALAPEPPAAGSGGDRLPELPTRLEDLDEQFLAHELAPPPAPRTAIAGNTGAPSQAPPTTRPQATSTDAAARETVHNVFAVKQPASAGNRHGFAIAVGGLTFLAVVAIGGYFYWQLQPKSRLTASPTALAVAPPPAPAPPVASPITQSATPPALPAATSVPAPAPAMEDARAPTAPTLPPKTATEPRPATTSTADALIRLSPTASRKIDPALDRAYQAFNRGEADLARTSWQNVLRTDPRNADALHGLAALAQQAGQPAQAVDYYLRALEADPKDALALAGLVSLNNAVDVQLNESRIKTLLAEQPDSPYLNFALGNLYAQAFRWAEAQQAYFKAHVADAANPDYLYNLAVSLDHLHQARPAAQYYARALEAAGKQPASFDLAQVTNRLKQLDE